MRAKTPYEKGASACRRSVPMQENPYTHETTIQSRNNREWKRGYADQAADHGSQRAIRQLIEVTTRLAEIVHELDPGKDMSAVSDALADARQSLTHARAFER